jgi:hypothetical protein
VAAGELNQAPAAALRWELLESQPPSGERLTARLAVPSSRDDVFIALDAAGRRYVLVAIPAGEPRELAERISRGVDVRTLEMNAGTGALQPFVEIACLETEGHAALDTIALEIVAALQAGASIGRIRLVQNVLAKWRRFWSGVSQGLLSKEQQIGLFGELWFLCRWLAPAVGASQALQMWRGPTGARNDFEVQGVGIEAKTTSRLDAAHVIHGLEQLLEPPGGSLFLFSLCVRDEASGTDSLPRLVDEVRRLLIGDFVALSQFESAVAVVGYDDRLAGEYAKLVLRIREEGLYRVVDGFPRLIPTSLSAGLPPGVNGVTYELRLEAAATWLLARTPAAAAALLCDFTR